MHHSLTLLVDIERTTLTLMRLLDADEPTAKEIVAIALRVGAERPEPMQDALGHIWWAAAEGLLDDHGWRFAY